MKKKALAVLMASVMTAAAVTGCGNKTEEKNAAATDTQNAATDAASETNDATATATAASEDAIQNLIKGTDGPVNLNVWCSETEQYQTVMKKLCDDFAAQYPDIDLNVTVGAVSEADMKDRVLEDVEAAADVFFFPDDQMESLVKAGALNEIQAQYTYDMDGADIPATVEAGKYDGKQYGYPFTASNGYFLYYDSSKLSADDVSSWEKLTRKADELGMKVGCEMANGWYLYGWFAGAGCSLTENEDQSNSCDWNSEQGLAAAQAVSELCKADSFKSYGNDDLLAQLNDGKICAYVSGTWNVQNFQKAYGDGYAATKLPTFEVNGEAKQMCSYSGYKFAGVNAYSKNPGWAMLLSEYLTNGDSQATVYTATGEGPSNKEALKAASSPALDALAAQSKFAQLQKVGGAYWDPATALGQNILEGNVTQQILDDAVAGITQPVETE